MFLLLWLSDSHAFDTTNHHGKKYRELRHSIRFTTTPTENKNCTRSSNGVVFARGSSSGAAFCHRCSACQAFSPLSRSINPKKSLFTSIGNDVIATPITQQYQWRQKRKNKPPVSFGAWPKKKKGELPPTFLPFRRRISGLFCVLHHRVLQKEYKRIKYITWERQKWHRIRCLEKSKAKKVIWRCKSTKSLRFMYVLCVYCWRSFDSLKMIFKMRWFQNFITPQFNLYFLHMILFIGVIRSYFFFSLGQHVSRSGEPCFVFVMTSLLHTSLIH